MDKKGILYIVSTPIGNLDDITYRAVKILSQVDVVICEDTRHTLNLLNFLNIKGKRLICCNAINEKESSDGIIKLLSTGLDMAYCSDAGTPSVSDPGSFLVNKVRECDFKIVPVPGPSAVSTIISVSGIHGKTFLFEGFFSIKEGKRKKRLTELIERKEPFVFYESPYRIIKVLTELKEISSNLRVVVGREMTKIHEEFIVGTVDEVVDKLKIVKGEFAVCVLPNMCDFKLEKPED